jgi:hypothetical protein
MALTVADVRHEIVLLSSHFFISRIPRWHHTANRCGSNVIPHGFVYVERKFELLLVVTLCMSRSYCRSQTVLSIYGEPRVSTSDFHFTGINNSILCLSCGRFSILTTSFVMPRCQWEMSSTSRFFTEEASRGSVG